MTPNPAEEIREVPPDHTPKVVALWVRRQHSRQDRVQFHRHGGQDDDFGFEPAGSIEVAIDETLNLILELLNGSGSQILL